MRSAAGWRRLDAAALAVGGAAALFALAFMVLVLAWPPAPRAVLPETYADYPASLSPDGRLLTTISGSVPYKGPATPFHSIRLWDTTDGRELTVDPVDEPGRRASFTPDNTLLAVTDEEGSAVYAIGPEVLAGARPKGLPVVARWADRVARGFSPDGRWLALGTGRVGDEATVLWDVARRRDARTLAGAGGRSAFSRNGQLVVVETRFEPDRPPQLKLWATDDGRALGTIPEADAYNWAVDPSGAMVAVGRRREGEAGKWKVELWAVEPFERVATVPDALYPTFVPDDRTLVASQDPNPINNAAVIWDIARRAERARVPIRAETLTGDASLADFLPEADGRGLLARVAGAADGNAALVRLDLAGLRVQDLFVDRFYEVRVAPRGGTIVVKNRGGPNQVPWLIHVWDDRPRRPIGKILLASALVTLAVVGALGLCRLVRAAMRRAIEPSRAARRCFGVLNMLIGLALFALAGAGLLAASGGSRGVGLDGDERRLIAYLYADVLTAIPLNLLLFASGVVLLKREPSGPASGVAVAVLKLARLGLIAGAWTLAAWRYPTVVLAVLAVVALAAIYPLLLLRALTRRPGKVNGLAAEI